MLILESSSPQELLKEVVEYLRIRGLQLGLDQHPTMKATIKRRNLAEARENALKLVAQELEGAEIRNLAAQHTEEQIREFVESHYYCDDSEKGDEREVWEPFEHWTPERLQEQIDEDIESLKNFLEAATQTPAQPKTASPAGWSKEDFTFQLRPTGYMLQYKLKNIGGVSILGVYKGRNKQKQIKEYAQDANREVKNLLEGRGQQRFIDAINKIEGAN